MLAVMMAYILINIWSYNNYMTSLLFHHVDNIISYALNVDLS